jgi:hypothetical protein
MWAPAQRRLGPRRDLRARLRRGRRRPLGPAPAGAAPVGWRAARCASRVADAVPPPRLLPRHGAAMGLDARAAPTPSAQPVRLHRRRQPAAERRRARGWCMSMRRRSRSRAAGQCALSGMADRPIRWIVDDATKFTAREVRRGRRYDGILLDPPKFGRGPKARCGGSRSISRRCSPTAASCSTPTAASWC